jgi:hypothetical protein
MNRGKAGEVLYNIMGVGENRKETNTMSHATNGNTARRQANVPPVWPAGL